MPVHQLAQEKKVLTRGMRRQYGAAGAEGAREDCSGNGLGARLGIGSGVVLDNLSESDILQTKRSRQVVDYAKVRCAFLVYRMLTLTLTLTATPTLTLFLTLTLTLTPNLTTRRCVLSVPDAHVYIYIYYT